MTLQRIIFSVYFARRPPTIMLTFFFYSEVIFMILMYLREQIPIQSYLNIISNSNDTHNNSLALVGATRKGTNERVLQKIILLHALDYLHVELASVQSAATPATYPGILLLNEWNNSTARFLRFTTYRNPWPTRT